METTGESTIALRDAVKAALTRLEVCAEMLRAEIDEIDDPLPTVDDLIERRASGDITEAGLYRLTVKRAHQHATSRTARAKHRAEVAAEDQIRDELQGRIYKLAPLVARGELDAWRAVQVALGAVEEPTPGGRRTRLHRGRR